MAGKGKESAASSSSSFGFKTSNSGVPQSGSSAKLSSRLSGTHQESSSGAASQPGTRGSSSGAVLQSGTNNENPYNPYAHSTDQATTKSPFGAPSSGNHGKSSGAASHPYAHSTDQATIKSSSGAPSSRNHENSSPGFPQGISSLGKNSANHTKPCTTCPGLRQQLANEKEAVRKLQGEVEREKEAVKRAEVRKKETEPGQAFKPELKTEKDVAHCFKSSFHVPPKPCSTACAELKSKLEMEIAAVQSLQGELTKEKATVVRLHVELQKERAEVSKLNGLLRKEETVAGQTLKAERRSPLWWCC